MQQDFVDQFIVFHAVLELFEVSRVASTGLNQLSQRRTVKVLKMNLILPKEYHLLDVEARLWNNGGMYIYGSYDISGDTFYCSKEDYVFSSKDLISGIITIQ